MRYKINYYALILLLISTHSLLALNAYADESNSLRERILEEIKTVIKDDDLANQILEIRLKRDSHRFKPTTSEKLEIRPEIETPQSSNQPLAKTPSKNSDTSTSEHLKSIAPTNFTKNRLSFSHASLGTDFSVGYSAFVSEGISLRGEVFGRSYNESSQQLANSQYVLNTNNLSLGVYTDWHILNTPFRLSTGLNINHIRTSLTPNTGMMVLNGKPISLGDDLFKVEFRFPKVSPYIGIVYANDIDQKDGLHLYGELGIMVGKYNASATTSMVDKKGITSADIDTELNTLRKSLYKWDFIPRASVGLIYRFH